MWRYIGRLFLPIKTADELDNLTGAVLLAAGAEREQCPASRGGAGILPSGRPRFSRSPTSSSIRQQHRHWATEAEGEAGHCQGNRQFGSSPRQLDIRARIG